MSSICESIFKETRVNGWRWIYLATGYSALHNSKFMTVSFQALREGNNGREPERGHSSNGLPGLHGSQGTFKRAPNGSLQGPLVTP